MFRLSAWDESGGSNRKSAAGTALEPPGALMIHNAAKFWRFASGLWRFLSATLAPDECRRIAEADLRNRANNFLRLLNKAVYQHPASPYYRLLRWAGVEYGDVARLVAQDGVEAALARLFDAGVHVGLEEFKGRCPIERPGLRIDVAAGDTDNPLLAREFETETSGSTGPRRRAAVDFDLLVHDAAVKFLGLMASGIEQRPMAIWRSVPPASSGLKNALIAAKCGRPLERWFTPCPVSWKPGDLGFAAMTAASVAGGRVRGHTIPAPCYVPLQAPLPIAHWLAGESADCRLRLLCTAVGMAVRVCRAALEHGIEIRGAMFRVGGEPLTPAKAEAIARAGASWVSAWAMSETGVMGVACGNREARDEVHVVPSKVALLERSKVLPDRVSRIDALYLTTLHTASPKIMLNVDSGDYGVLTSRRCGCPLERIGWDTHLHSIRNYEKSTAGGMHFLGREILTLVEEVLPSRHGGSIGDYQLEEEEEGALTRVTIAIAPGVGRVEEGRVKQTVLEFLGSSNAGGKLMARLWREGEVLRVVRREPYYTPSGKVPPLRTVRKDEHASS